jgi:hypothetical protein
MQALIFCLLFPVIPLLVWQSYQGKETTDGRGLFTRYAVYTLVMTLFTCIVMTFLCDEGTSFLEKADTSSTFMLKYALMEALAAGIVSAAEWMYTTRRLVIRINWQEYRKMGISRFIQKVLFPCGIYLTAVAVVLLNISLMFDNVLWGDECFSANTAQKSADGILQVLYFWDNHPPLHYYWLKMFGDLFGHTGPVYHLASLTPFFMGVILALVFLRRRFGNILAAFFIIITGTASSCLQYNLEIRMYSLAFLGVACCYYCAYRVLSGGKLAWFGMVFWALVGAYSHYYAMMAVGIMIFITGVAAAVRYRGRTWLKGLIALIVFIVGYTPWLRYLFHATNSVSNNWWMTEIMGLQDSLQMVLCGAELEKLVLCMLVVFLGAMLLVESSFFQIRRKDDGTELQIHAPSLKNWSDETYGAAVGFLTIVGTLIAAYVLCLIVGPVLAQRYLYPLSAVTILLLVISGRGILNLIKRLGEEVHRQWLEKAAKCVLVVLLAVIAVIGIKNYNAYSTQVKAQKAVTEQALYLIGDVPEDTALVSNNVKHLAWTVLYYYYPDREITAGSCSDEGTEYEKFWYFTPETLSTEELQKMSDKGYKAAGYGQQQIAIYPFWLYYFEKVK